MATSCGARSCLSIFLSYDRGPPKLPVARAYLAKAIPAEEASNEPRKGEAAQFHCPENSILSHHAAVSTARPRTRVRGLCNRVGPDTILVVEAARSSRVAA